jgi:putative holliday junction resolvase
VGLPKNMDGSEGESAQNARAFAERLHNETGLQVDLQDERGTTITAHNFLNDTNTRGKKRKNVVDEVAATIILQNYLDKRKNSKNY